MNLLAWIFLILTSVSLILLVVAPLVTFLIYRKKRWVGLLAFFALLGASCLYTLSNLVFRSVAAPETAWIENALGGFYWLALVVGLVVVVLIFVKSPLLRKQEHEATVH